VSAAARTANGNEQNSKRPLNFFVAFRRRAKRVPFARCNMGNKVKSSSGMVERNEDERLVTLGKTVAS